MGVTSAASVAEVGARSKARKRAVDILFESDLRGLDPLESDPRFHQQMVYAVAMKVLENFEEALGRTLTFKERRPLRLAQYPDLLPAP